MTYGIYKLTFNNIFYIGKSHNIEDRFIGHCSNLRTNTAQRNLQKAYDEYGMPKLSIVEDTIRDPSHLAKREAYWIKRLNPHLNIREEHPNLTESKQEKLANDPIRKAFKLLVETDKSLIDIALDTGLTTKMLASLINLTDYQWLINDFPKEYNKFRQFSRELRLKHKI